MPAYVIAETDVHDAARYERYKAAKRWYELPEYAEVRKLREGAATMRLVAVEGT
jgi:uncharacterized protein (DUF1330 family)